LERVLLVVDIGSSSVRCSAFDERANMVEGTLQRETTGMSPVGTMDPVEIEEKTVAVISRCLETLRARPNPPQVIAVGMDCFAMSWLAIDHSGTAISPVYTYADARSAPYAQRLREELGDAQNQLMWNKTGTPVHTSYAMPQYKRLLQEDPAQCRAAAQWRTLGAHLVGTWMGRATDMPVSFSEASWTGLLDRRALTWHGEACGLAGLPIHKLPPLADYDEAVTGLQQRYAERWPELCDVPFFLAVGDGAAANVGTGVVDSSAICVTIGTSAAARTVLHSEGGHAPQLSPGLWDYRISRHRHLVGGALTDGGSLNAWFGRTVVGGTDPQLWQEVAAMPPDSHGLTMLPFLSGERAPGYRGEAHCTITGIHPGTTPADMVRAGAEAVTMRLTEVMDVMQLMMRSPWDPASVQPQLRIVASGGVLENLPVMRTILADASGLPVDMPQCAEATSRGVAVLVLEALHTPVQAELEVASITLPDPTATKVGLIPPALPGSIG